MKRHLASLAFAAMLAGPPAAAQVPPPAAPICSGKYEVASRIVDAAYAPYGTLYAGGDHFHVLEGVGATIDVYRLIKGWPDLDLHRALESPDWRSNIWGEEDQGQLGQSVTSEQVWSRAAWAWKADATTNSDPKARFWASWGADIITSAGPVPDWFLRPGASDDLTPSQVWVADKTRTEPALSWLQMVLAGSNTPWANIPQYQALPPSVVAAHERIADAAYAHYQRGEGLEWLVAAAINQPHGTNVERIKRSLSGIADDIRACTATPGAYAAYASSFLVFDQLAYLSPGETAYNVMFRAMPPAIRAAAVERRVLSALSRNVFGDPKERDAIITALRSDEPDGSSHSLRTQGLDLLELHTATRIEQIPLSDAPKMRRAYNALSADDIAALARRPGATPALIRAAFSRHVALGQDAKARSLIPALKAALPESAATIDRIWSGRQPESVRLALLILDIPDMTTLVRWSGRFDGSDPDFALLVNADYLTLRRNLPPEFRTAAYLQRDYEVAAFASLDAYWSMHGRTISWLDRHDRRRENSRVAPNRVPTLIASGPGKSVPFAALIAWSELARLTGDERLMHTVARRILAWTARAGGADGQPEALARLIAICRQNSCGTAASGIPAQRAAFLALKSRYARTEPAQATRYWYPSPTDS